MWHTKTPNKYHKLYLEDITEENVKVCRQVLHIHAESSKTGGRLAERTAQIRREKKHSYFLDLEIPQ